MIQRNPVIYLSGPIFGCTDTEARLWRNEVRDMGVCYVLDPLRRDFRGHQKEHMDEIVELDKIDIGKCDALLINYSKPSVGSSMEVLYAWERNKLVVVVCDNDKAIGPWLRYHSHGIFPTIDEALRFIMDHAS